MSGCRLCFSEVDWETASPGIRVKVFKRDGKSIRLLELSKGLDHPDWCVVGHTGYVVEGVIEIIFEDRSENFSSGDGILIRPGVNEKHIPKPISEKAVLFLIDEY
ncbi:MAG: phosrestin [Acidobacteria bacterium]|nr:phosrestin [Acidobacteriota bacterium]